jgi:hypothetical protein
MFEIFGMEDCVVELLLKYRTDIAALADVDACLDILTPPLVGKIISYARYKGRFEQNPASFYPAGG